MRWLLTTRVQRGVQEVAPGLMMRWIIKLFWKFMAQLSDDIGELGQLS